MMHRKTNSGNIIAYIVLTLAALTMIFPFYWMVSTALKPGTNVLKIPPDFFPWPISFESFNAVLNYANIFRAFLNTLIISLSVTFGTLFTSSLAAYSFSKIKFDGSRKIYGIFLATIMVPSQITLIPMYMIFSKIGWTDSFLPLIVPGIMINAYGIFMIRSFMEGIPDSYVESAYIDGANPFWTYLRIIVPLLKPITVTLGLFSFIGAWNDFMGALIYIDSEQKFTITLLLSTFKSQYNINWGNIMAASTLAILPIVVFYFFSQKFFIEGITMSGLKG